MALAAVAPNVLLHDMSLYFGPANASALGLPQPPPLRTIVEQYVDDFGPGAKAGR